MSDNGNATYGKPGLPSNIHYLIFGGAGSLGTALVRRILEMGSDVTVFSRDEAKHFHQRNLFPNESRLKYIVGDIRDADRVIDVVADGPYVRIINAAAIKQVPLCEEFPAEAVKTNVIGSMNIARALGKVCNYTQAISISTDKACKPINAYGNTKALQEKIHLNANSYPVKANVVRYGNVLCSTGSVIPYFKSLLEQDKPLTLTEGAMTRFLLSLDDAVDLIFAAFRSHQGGQIFVPKVQSAYIWDLGLALCKFYGKDPSTYMQRIAVRPGEKTHEILISEAEAPRVRFNSDLGCFQIQPEKSESDIVMHTEDDFSSGSKHNLLLRDELKDFLASKGVIKCAKSESPEPTASSVKTSPPIWTKTVSA